MNFQLGHGAGSAIDTAAHKITDPVDFPEKDQHSVVKLQLGHEVAGVEFSFLNDVFVVAPFRYPFDGDVNLSIVGF